MIFNSTRHPLTKIACVTTISRLIRTACKWIGASYRRIWLNPPYGRTIGKWMQKAAEESAKGCLVVCLVPARVDTKWWHNWVLNRAKVTFFKGRLRFIKYSDGSAVRSGGAPFPSALVIYEPDLSSRFNFPYDLLERKCCGSHPAFGQSASVGATARRPD